MIIMAALDLVNRRKYMIGVQTYVCVRVINALGISEVEKPFCQDKGLIFDGRGHLVEPAADQSHRYYIPDT